MRTRSLLALPLTFLLLGPACDDTSDDGGGSGGGAPAGQSCNDDSECPVLSCTCVEFDVTGGSCDVMADSPTCLTTCEQACEPFGGVAAGGGDGCLDPTAGSPSEQGTIELGGACVPGASPGTCDSSLCFPIDPLNGFCSKACTIDAECGGVVCRTYTAGGVTSGLCAPANVTFCDG